MIITNTKIPEVKLIMPSVFEDERGFFFESFNKEIFEKKIGFTVNFVQDNHSMSKKNVLRGLHYQHPPYAQGKLVRVVYGEVFDVAVDLRTKSSTYGMWVAEKLSGQNKKQLWIPEGFAHGYLTLSETAEVVYKTTNFWVKNSESCIAWNDPVIDIHWPLNEDIIMSSKDSHGKSLSSV